MTGTRTYDVRITVVETLKGKCSQGFKPGDSWLVTRNITPSNMCQSAFVALYPALRTMRYGGELPFAKDQEAIRISCPDSSRIVVYELRRIPKAPAPAAPAET